MAISTFRVESFLDSEELHYFRRTPEEGESESGAWVLFFGNKTAVVIRLIEDGECLLLRSTPVLHLDEYDREGQLRVMEAMAHRNDQLIVGRFCGTTEVVFEAALPIEDADVTDKQMKRLLSVVVSESTEFGEKLRRIAYDDSADTKPDPMDELMSKLIEGDRKSKE